MAYERSRREPVGSRWRSTLHAMKRLLREPLVHFLVIGGVLFGAYAFLERDRGRDASSKEIRLTLDDLAQLVMVFESKWRRPPNPRPLRGAGSSSRCAAP